MILCNVEEIYIFEHMGAISEHWNMGTCNDVNIKQLCSSSMHKHNDLVQDVYEVSILGSGALNLRFETC